MAIQKSHKRARKIIVINNQCCFFIYDCDWRNDWEDARDYHCKGEFESNVTRQRKASLMINIYSFSFNNFKLTKLMFEHYKALRDHKP